MSAETDFPKNTVNCNGEGGIRTRGTDKPYTAFPRLLLKPLGHLSISVPLSLERIPPFCKPVRPVTLRYYSFEN